MAELISPGGTIGILGGGQLGRMLAVAASRLGLKCHVYTDERGSPAAQVAAKTAVGAYDDRDAIAAFARDVEIVTCEFENVSAAALEAASGRTPLFPPAIAFAVTQDRLREKEFIHGLGIPVAPFARVDTAKDLRKALAKVKTPALLKTRRFGYDGKGQAAVRNAAGIEAAIEAIAAQPAIVEGMIAFEREISVIAVRGRDGGIGFYDPVENVHQDGILAISRVPADITDQCADAAKAIAAKIAAGLDHVGVLGVEMFHCEGRSPELIVNEIAPRVHNSGHWTLDACQVSQFENHIRAIAGWPLGSTARHSDAVMTNLIGAAVEDWRELAADGRAALHLYGKAEIRPGRKMGHLTRIYPKTTL
jgi:5-(carboxyamino)imidazole ribonucleotide synthase